MQNDKKKFVNLKYDKLNDNFNMIELLEYYDEKSKKLTVENAPKNAIQILTIHKSKGLEFPVVIIPFTNWDTKNNLDSPYTWVHDVSIENRNLDLLEESDDEEEFEDDFDSEDINLADAAENMGWSIDISGSAPRFVNEALMTWNSSINMRASIEAPFLMQLMGMRFRFGAEFGTFGFEDAMPPKTAELKGITAMGITSFPVGPGK